MIEVNGNALAAKNVVCESNAFFLVFGPKVTKNAGSDTLAVFSLPQMVASASTFSMIDSARFCLFPCAGGDVPFSDRNGWVTGNI
jgi:hypothetical protein